MAQNNTPDYLELRQYKALLDAEKQDSTYHKALTKYGNEKASNPFFKGKPMPLWTEFAAIKALPTDTGLEWNHKIETFCQLSEKAAAKKDKELELLALSEAFSIAFWTEPRNYAKAFLIAASLEKCLSKINTSFVGSKEAWVKLGEAFYLFKDYEKSIRLLKNVIDKEPLSFQDCTHLEALRISGICYANMNQLIISDSCFLTMLQCPDRVMNRPMYNAIALSCLGCNAMLKGEYDKALVLDLMVLPDLKNEKDYGHIAGMYACLGFSYFGKREYANMREVIDSIFVYAHKDYYNRNKRLKQAYTLSAQYYTAMGDIQKAQLYNDSLVSIYKLEEAAFSSRFITDAYQEENKNEMEAKAMLLKKQKEWLLYSVILLVCSCSVLFVIICLYRQKRAAYSALVERSQKWAKQNECNQEIASQPDKPSTEEQSLMKQIHSLVVVEKRFKDPELTLNSLAEVLSVNRSYVSAAINKTTGKSFVIYVNEYRVKEAIQIMSDLSKRNNTIDQIADLAGFSNRQSFYESFKKITGLSPSEFKKNSAQQ